MRRCAVLLGVLALFAVAATSAGASVERNVSAKFNRFDPNRIVAITNDTVTWKNNEFTTDHDILADGVAFSSPLDMGQSYSWLADTPGTYPYHCTIHPFMRGTVIVSDLYFAGPSSPVLFGKLATLSGYAPENTSVAINLIDGDANPVATVQSSSTGKFSATIPVVPGLYQAVSGSTTSSNIRINVKPKLNVATRKRGTTYWITVSAKPNQQGAKMVLERRKGSGWRKLSTHRLGARSKTVFKVVPSATWKVRLRLSAPVNGYAKTTTKTLTLRR